MRTKSVARPFAGGFASHIVATMLALMGLMGTASAQSTSLFDDFNTENGGIPIGWAVLNYDTFANFDVISGAVDLVAGGYDEWGSLEDHGLIVDLDGTDHADPPHAGTMQTKNVFPAGSYTLRFDLAGSQRSYNRDGNLCCNEDSVTVTFGDYSETITLSWMHPFTTYARLVTAGPGGSVLTFKGLGGDFVGLFLDNVAVNPAATIDIKPGSYPNVINLGSKGKVPVAILSTKALPATDVSPSTVSFAGAPPVMWSFEDVNGDGVPDLVLHYRTQDLNLASDATKACIAGMTTSGTPFEGCDGVKIVPMKWRP